LGQLINRRRRAVIGLASMFGGAACLVATIPGQASADPPGNNGTVKVDGEEFDDHPDNEPHVGCIFQVDWYGFDEGEDLFSHVTFEVHPPTGKPEVILEDEVFIGEDDNSGGGSEAGLDASETYDLSTLLQAFEPHPNQGWHVKLTVNNDGSQGADVKHKVFWVSGCETPPTTSTSTTSTTEKPTTTSTTEGPTTSTTEKPTTTSTTEGPTTTSTTEKPTTTSTTEGPTTSSTEGPTTSSTEGPTTTSTTEKPTTTSTTEGPTTSSTEGPTTSSTEGPTTSSTEGPTTSSTEGPTTSSTEATSTTAAAPSSSTTSSAVSPAGELPKTGGESQVLLIAAGLTLLVGGGALLASAKLEQKRLADA
jgi:LPXTG-motif cell wall-anchored protein